MKMRRLKLEDIIECYTPNFAGVIKIVKTTRLFAYGDDGTKFNCCCDEDGHVISPDWHPSCVYYRLKSNVLVSC